MIVDDIAETREQLRKLLSFDPEIDVVSMVGSGEEGVLTVTADQQFRVEVDGISSGSITVSGTGADASRSMAAWATAIEEEINSDATLSAAGKTVTVAVNADGDGFDITSTAQGTASQVSILPFVTPTSGEYAGITAAGTITAAGGGGGSQQR